MALLKTVVVIDCEGDFYPPAAVAMGLPVERLLVVRARKAADAFWAADQALRCEAVAAVVATRLPLDDVRSRRLQLSAERSGSVAVMLSPDAGAAARHTFATFRLRIEPVERIASSVDVGRSDAEMVRRCRIAFLKTRERMPVESIIVGLSDEAFDVSPHSVFADRTVEAFGSADRRRIA